MAAVPASPATGDVKNAWEKMQAALRSVKSPSTVAEALAKEGRPEAFLPLLHYVFLDYSALVAAEMAAKHELYAKNDAKFVEGLFAALPALYGYRPALSAPQFLRKGFAETKMLLVADCARLARARRRDLSRDARSAKKYYVPPRM